MDFRRIKWWAAFLGVSLLVIVAGTVCCWLVLSQPVLRTTASQFVALEPKQLESCQNWVVQLTGRVETIASTGGAYCISIVGPDEDSIPVNCFFPVGKTEAAKDLRAGDLVTIRGTSVVVLTRLPLYELLNCVLIEVHH